MLQFLTLFNTLTVSCSFPLIIRRINISTTTTGLREEIGGICHARVVVNVKFHLFIFISLAFFQFPSVKIVC